MIHGNCLRVQKNELDLNILVEESSQISYYVKNFAEQYTQCDCLLTEYTILVLNSLSLHECKYEVRSTQMVNTIYFKKIEVNEREAYNGIFVCLFLLYTEITKIF